jgi:hypothetical protein
MLPRTDAYVQWENTLFFYGTSEDLRSTTKGKKKQRASCVAAVDGNKLIKKKFLFFLRQKFSFSASIDGWFELLRNALAT